MAYRFKVVIMGAISMIVILLSEFVPAHPLHEITLGDRGVHDGIWDAERVHGGTFICCGYMDGLAWMGSLSTDMEIEWQLLAGSDSTNDEAVAICPFLDSYAVAVNSGVRSPGARHMLSDATGWVMLVGRNGEKLDSLSCTSIYTRAITGIAPGSDSTLACCGTTFCPDPQGYGIFWLMDTEGKILRSGEYGTESITSLNCIESVPEGGYILGGSSSVLPSFTVIRVDSAGRLQWRCSAGPDLSGLEAREIIITDKGSCIAAGGGFSGNPMAVEIDMETGELIGVIADEGWYTLFGCDSGTGELLYIGHNMLCDGADSETYITGFNTDDSSLPLQITGYGACRCRTLISSGDTLFVFGEVSEFWDGHQDSWAAATVRSDWIPQEEGSRLNADFD